MVKTVIKPTVGRNVLFWPPTGGATPMADFYYADIKQPCVGFICYVWSERMINLMVVDQNGVQHAVTSVELIQSGEPKPEGGRFACWMDYQVGQAAKTEQLQSELDDKAAAMKQQRYPKEER